ncbi:hypothetical protein [Azotobacter beijerinckii]|uniref:hypothetical protein n=1 Tax=Azotobacter beijerinckii TaxID=170623 RepID=UPI002952A03E|nr:hypothetical protein [Azotobacter beijerinckii]MDV7213396.1 hypothetical protein [Azotobacter beijerinckii]
MLGVKRAFTTFIGAQLLLAGHIYGENSSNEDENVYKEYLIDTSLPFSNGATEEITDVRSPFVWQKYQAGILDGWHYRFSPDGSAVFSRSPRLHDDAYRVSCERAQGCTITEPDGKRMNIASYKAPLPTGNGSDGLSIAKKYVSWIFENSKALRSSFPDGKNKPIEQTGNNGHEKETAPATPKAGKTPGQKKNGSSHRSVTPKTNQRKKPDAQTTRPAIQSTSSQNFAPEKPGDQTVTGREAAGQVATSPPDNAPIQVLTNQNDKSTSCAVSSEYGFRYYDNASEKKKSGKEKFSLTCASMFFSNVTMRGTANYYPEHSDQQPWDPDYTFSLVYHYSKNIDLEYSNYSGNRFPWHDKKGTGGLGSGSLRASHAIPDTWNRYIDDRTSLVSHLRCATSVATSPEYQKESGSGNWKTTLGLSCAFNPLDFNRFGIVFTGLYYPFSGQKQNWDPDYTLSMTYQISEKFSMDYSNYSGGRWPWSKDSGLGKNLGQGSLRMTYKID